MPLFRPLSFAVLVACACASAPSRPPPGADELKELRAQLDAQSSQVAQQQRRIEELEVKIAALTARAARPAPTPETPAAAPAPAKEPRPALKTVKLGEGKGRRPPLRTVDRAPRIPASVELREPDDESLERLETDPEIAGEFNADRDWAQAVRELNDGEHEQAEKDLLAFAAKNPRHSAADNAIALAGVAREVRGDCKGALPLFESVPQKYPAGDAVPQAMLERGRCLRILGRDQEAKPVLEQLVRDHPDAPEAQQAQRLLSNF